MSVDVTSDQQPAAPAGNQRSAKNLLLDRSFQLKYVRLSVLLTLAISIPLAALLYSQTNTTIRLASEANAAARQAVVQARLLNTKLAFDAMIAAKGDAARIAAAKKENAAATAEIETRARKVEAQQAALKTQQSMMLGTVGGGLALLVVLVGLLGVVITHKVAGPIHRMRAMFREVGDGVFNPNLALRKGDELQEFFLDFTGMVQKLRARQRAELERLDKAIDQAQESGAGPASIRDLREARESLKTAIGKSIPPPSDKT